MNAGVKRITYNVALFLHVCNLSWTVRFFPRHTDSKYQVALGDIPNYLQKTDVDTSIPIVSIAGEFAM